MTKPHPAQLRAALTNMLAVDRVLTTVQLERRGLLRTAEQLGLPTTVRTCRTRVTQAGSAVDLTFVSALPGLGGLSSTVLMHWAGLAEQRWRILQFAVGLEFEWQHLDVKGVSRGHLPDVTLHPSGGAAIAVEFDAGYPPQVIEAKLRGAGAAGYQGVLWGTTVRRRVLRVPGIVTRLRQQGELSGLRTFRVDYVDIASPGDPYRLRPYSDVPVSAALRLQRERAAGSGARVGSQPASSPR